MEGSILRRSTELVRLRLTTEVSRRLTSKGVVNVLGRLAKGMLVMVVCAIPLLSPVWAQEPGAASSQEGPAQLKLRRTVKSREYQGKSVEGEERAIRPRDTLWRILVQERGLSEKRFNRYVILVAALNPRLKRPDVLQIGDILFIPLQADEILGIKSAQAAAKESEATRLYRVKRGEHLYKILREQLGLQDLAKLRSAAEQVKRLNPDRTNWDNLVVGATIRLPGAVGSAVEAMAKPTIKQGEEPAQIVGLDYGQKISAQENLDLLASVMDALGQQTNREGEEVVALSEGTVHIDRSSYPVIQNSKKGQRAILDLQSQITSSLRTKLEAEATAVPVVSLKKGASLHEAVTSLLARLGYQTLPSNQPVVVQDRGVAVQVTGEWMVASLDESGAGPRVLVVSLIDLSGQTPDYLRDYLSLKGMSLKEILLPSSNSPVGSLASPSGGRGGQGRIESWPSDKAALVDAFLNDYGISFSSAKQLSVTLRDGIRMDAKVDRLFEYGGKKVALSFRSLGDEVQQALQQSEGIRIIEMDLATLSSRELVARLLAAVGESATYREQRFQANDRGAKDKLALAISGYYLPQRSLLLTDREIPKELERFFGEKGLRVVRFQ